MIQAQYAEITSGPLPDAQQLEHYDHIVPGASDRIITMAETQAAQRQKLEYIVVSANARDSLLGVICGFAICLVAIIAGAIVIMNGHDWAGTVIGGSGIVGLASVFVYGTRSGRKERAEKEKGVDTTE